MPKKKKTTTPWLRQRGYRHFDLPSRRVTEDSFAAEHVAKHGFFPFIGITRVTLRYRKGQRKVESKRRELTYASHRDASIFAYYSELLSKRYEGVISELGISRCVLAYRKLPGNPCNIHHAKEVFDEIASRGDCDVISTDVQDFFHNLQHELIKSQWMRVLEVDRLPEDHFAVFKNICKYRWVKLETLTGLLNISKSSLSNKSGAGKRRRRLGELEQLRSMFKTAGVVIANDSEKGVPQGSPISALISNIYMMDVDAELERFATREGGLYRRYSDDILIVVRAGQLELAKNRLRDALQSVKLDLHPNKTLEFQFRRRCERIEVENPLDYLGFTFDGDRIKLRDRTVSCFIHRMIRAVKRAYRATKSKGEKKLRKSKLYESYSHKGKRNFIAYAKRASKIMYPNTTSRTPIKSQIRNLWKLLHIYIKRAEQKLQKS